MLIASDGRKTNTQSHDKWNGHGAGRHAAGIKGDSKKISGNKGSQGKHKQIEDDEQRSQCHGKKHSEGGNHQKQPDAACHGKDQRQIRNGRNLSGKYLQVRL